jgi:hypothetical protein
MHESFEVQGMFRVRAPPGMSMTFGVSIRRRDAAPATRADDEHSRDSDVVRRMSDRGSTTMWFAAIVGAGIVLRLWQMSARSSLWLDEAALARNIVDKSFADLFGPLDYGQVAPAGYLLLERAAVLALGRTELVLRLLPLASGVLALVFFAMVARRLLTPWTSVLAVWLFAAGVPFIFFSANAKPYAVDVLAAVVIAWSASVPWTERNTPRALAIGSIGLLAWIANAAVLLLAGTGLALALMHLRRRAAGRRDLAIVAALWIATAMPPVLVAVRNVSPDDSLFLHRRWAQGFMPVNPRHALRWGWDRVFEMFGASGSWTLDGGLHYGQVWLTMMLIALGVVWFWRERRDALLVLTAPIAVALGASVMRMYPFTGRFVIFVLPALLLLLAAGIVEVSRLLRTEIAGVLAGAVLVAISTRALVRTPPPQRQEDLRPVLSAMALQCRPGDTTYVYYGAGQAYLFYAPGFALPCGSHVITRCARGRPETLLEDFDALRGHSRIWIVLAHGSKQHSEIDTLLRHVESAGRRLAQLVDGPGYDAQAYLYEMNDAAWRQTTTGAAVSLRNDAAAWECSGPLLAR